MKYVMDDRFRRKGSLDELIDTEHECPSCGQVNTIDDIIELMPTMFEIYSRKNIDGYKVNDDVRKHLEDDDVQ